MLKPGIKKDPVGRWALPDRIFFGNGACAIPAGVFLKEAPLPGFYAERIIPGEGFAGNHIFVTDGVIAFDHHGYSLRNRLLTYHTNGWANRSPEGWNCRLERVTFDLLDRRNLNDNKMLGPDQYLHDPIARAETYLGRVNHIEASARARANVALTSLELSDEKRDMVLRSLTNVGATKPIGYLPLYTIKEFLRSDPETIAADAAMRGLTTAQFAQNACCIKSGALYAYHRAALGDLLRENAAAVRVAGLPLDPDEFVAHVAANWHEMGHEAHPLIAAAFGEKFVENPAVLSRPEHYQ